MRRLRSLLACGAAGALVMAGAAGAALADTAETNGDRASSNNSGHVEFGAVDCNVADTSNVTLWIERKRANNDETFANGATVTFRVTGVTGSGLTAESPTTAITMPSTWTGQADKTASPSVTAPVRIQSTTPGDGSGKVEYVASGARNGGGTLTLNTFVNVKWTTGPCATNTAPNVSISGVSAGASYEYGRVPTAMCHVTDKEDGPSSFAASINAGEDVVDGIGAHTASCSYTDRGGLTASASVTYTVTRIPTSIVLTCEGTVTYTGSALTPCTATLSGRDLPSGAAATISYEHNINAGTATATASYPGGPHHHAAEDVSAEFTIDKAPSTVTLTCPETAWFTGIPIKPCSARVTGAGGLDLALPVGYEDNIMPGIATATASYGGGDNHKPSGPETATFEIKGYDLAGFYKPVDMDNVNIVKAGSTVPLKFEVSLNGVGQTDTAVVKGITMTPFACDTGATSGAVKAIGDTGGTALRYDVKAGQFIQNWQTPKSAGACYTVTMTTIDGGSFSANFQLK